MNIYEIVDLSTGLFEAIVAFMLFGNYMEKRDSMPKYTPLIGVIVLAIGINAINKFLNYNILNVFCIAFFMLLITFVYKADLKTRIALSIISVVISSCSEVIILLLLVLLEHTDTMGIYLNPSLRILGIALSKSLNLAIVKVLCVLSNRNNLKMPISYWILYTTVFIVDLVTIYVIFNPQLNGTIHYMQTFCAIGLLYGILITLYLYERMSLQSENLKEKELLEQQYKNQVGHLKELMLAQEQISTYHDLSNHMLSLKSYLDHHNYEEGNEYLSTLIEKTDLYSDVIDTGNIVIDAIITAKRNLAHKNEIEFNINLQIPENLNINSADCCVILGNALDNAIEACAVIQENKYINMHMAYHENMLSCKITNPVAEENKRNKFLVTTKRDAKNHGIGTKNIKRTLEKYKNVYRMEYENGEFVFAFILYDVFTKD